MNDKEYRPRLCGQCGGADLRKESPSRLRCAYCGSVYETQGAPAKVVINKGANVVFGKNAKVVIQGGLEIRDGANVSFEGELELVEKADETSIMNARQRLKEEAKEGKANEPGTSTAKK